MNHETISTVKNVNALTSQEISASTTGEDIDVIAKAIAKELREMVKAIKVVFQNTPPELSADIIQKGIIMTGGSSQLRNLGELIHRRTGVKARLAKDPFFCVAKGTGIALQHLDVYKRSVVSKRS